jgi:hypothetical protein
MQKSDGPSGPFRFQRHALTYFTASAKVIHPFNEFFLPTRLRFSFVLSHDDNCTTLICVRARSKFPCCNFTGYRFPDGSDEHSSQTESVTSPCGALPPYGPGFARSQRLSESSFSVSLLSRFPLSGASAAIAGRCLGDARRSLKICPLRTAGHFHL